MAFTKQKTFTARLDGTNAYELSKKLDRSTDKYKERLSVVENILDSTKFFELYFSDYFDANINNSDYLSLENNICLLLEQYGTYLLNSNDIKGDKKPEYKFYYDEYEFKKAVNKESFNGDNDTLDFLLSNQENYKKTKTQKITTKDLARDDWCGEVLRDYQKLINTINNKDLPLYTRNRIKGEVQRDMILAKDKILHVFGYNLRYFDESTKPSLEEIDFTNPKHLKGMSLQGVHNNYASVKGLLQMEFNGDFQDDFQCIIYDAHELIKKTNLTNNQLVAVEMYCDGYDINNIAKELDIKQPTATETLDSAIKKICNNAFELGYSSY